MRLDHQLRAVEAQETEAGTGPGSIALPKGWLETLELYSVIVGRLLSEMRQYARITKGAGHAGDLETGDESAELVGAVALLTDDELALAIRLRGAKDVNG